MYYSVVWFWPSVWSSVCALIALGSPWLMIRCELTHFQNRLVCFSHWSATLLSSIHYWQRTYSKHIRVSSTKSIKLLQWKQIAKFIIQSMTPKILIYLEVVDSMRLVKKSRVTRSQCCDWGGKSIYLLWWVCCGAFCQWRMLYSVMNFHTVVSNPG